MIYDTSRVNKFAYIGSTYQYIYLDRYLATELNKMLIVTPYVNKYNTF